MTGERADARKRNLAVVPCCDAAEKVARVRELADAWGHESPQCDPTYGNCCRTQQLRAALDGPAGGAA